MDEGKTIPYVKEVKNGDKTAWKAANKHGRIKYFGTEFKPSAIKHAGISEESIGGTPANIVGGGKVAGVGVGPQGEPGVIRSKYAKKNQAEAPSPIMEPMQKRKTFKEFTKG